MILGEASTASGRGVEVLAEQLACVMWITGGKYDAIVSCRADDGGIDGSGGLQQ